MLYTADDTLWALRAWRTTAQHSTLERQQENVGLRVCVQLCILNLLHGGHVMIFWVAHLRHNASVNMHIYDFSLHLCTLASPHQWDTPGLPRSLSLSLSFCRHRMQDMWLHDHKAQQTHSPQEWFSISICTQDTDVLMQWSHQETCCVK